MGNRFSNLNILAVEDNYINLSIVKKYFEIIGANSIGAYNGSECIELYEKSDIGHYDAIFIDLKMPILDGYSAVNKIRNSKRKDSNIFIVAMSGESYEDEMENVAKAGIDAYIEKPIDIEIIKELLNKNFFQNE